MSLYERWCDATREKDKRKYYWTYVEKHGGRDEIQGDLAETIRSHYDRLERIAEDVDRLGYKVAAEIAHDIARDDQPQPQPVLCDLQSSILATITAYFQHSDCSQSSISQANIDT